MGFYSIGSRLNFRYFLTLSEAENVCNCLIGSVCLDGVGEEESEESHPRELFPVIFIQAIMALLLFALFLALDYTSAILNLSHTKREIADRLKRGEKQ